MDAVGHVGTDTAINSGDFAGVLMVAVQALEKRTSEVNDLAQVLEKRTTELTNENHELKERLKEQAELKERLEKLERLLGAGQR